MCVCVSEPVPPKAHLGSAIISCILSLVIYGTLRFYAEWFISSQMTTIFGGFVSSWLFLFSLTSLSNVEMLLFGDDFASKFIPEILVCLLLSVLAAGVVHRVCATTWYVWIFYGLTFNAMYVNLILRSLFICSILFSILALYFVDRVSNDCYHKTVITPEAIHHRKGGGKKNK